MCLSWLPKPCAILREGNLQNIKLLSSSCWLQLLLSVYLRANRSDGQLTAVSSCPPAAGQLLTSLCWLVDARAEACCCVDESGKLIQLMPTGISEQWSTMLRVSPTENQCFPYRDYSFLYSNVYFKVKFNPIGKLSWIEHMWWKTD